MHALVSGAPAYHNQYDNTLSTSLYNYFRLWFFWDLTSAADRTQFDLRSAAF